MIQKPTRATFERFRPGDDFDEWWLSLVRLIPPRRDVDGLSPYTQQKLDRGQKVSVVPATVKAVLTALTQFELTGKKILILGKSDLLGRPLTGYWRGLGLDVAWWDKDECERALASPDKLKNFAVIVTATGTPGLIKGDMISDGVIIVDVGEPRPDVDLVSVRGKAAFLTPVPGGIGPLTILSLLENSLVLSQLDGNF